MNNLLLLLSFVVVCLDFQTQALKGKEFQCFKCESDYGGLCTDGFHSTGVQVVNCTGSCVKMIHRVNVNDLENTGYSRYCKEDQSPIGCTMTDEFFSEGAVHLEVTTCYCHRNLCNSAPAVSLSMCTSATVIFLWLLARHV